MTLTAASPVGPRCVLCVLGFADPRQRAACPVERDGADCLCLADSRWPAIQLHTVGANTRDNGSTTSACIRRTLKAVDTRRQLRRAWAGSPAARQRRRLKFTPNAPLGQRDGVPAGSLPFHYPGDEGSPTARRDAERLAELRAARGWRDPSGDGRMSIRAGYGMNGEFVNGPFIHQRRQRTAVGRAAPPRPLTPVENPSRGTASVLVLSNALNILIYAASVYVDPP